MQLPDFNEIKAVVIDIGGVLVRTANKSCRQIWEEKLNLQEGELDNLVFNSPEATLSTIGLSSEDKIWSTIQKRFNLTDDQLKDLIEDFWKMDFLDEGLLIAFMKLRKNFKTAILSNFWVGAREIVSRKFDLNEGVVADRIFFSCEIGVAKPDPQIYLYISKELKINFENILFIDDFIENIEAADLLGMKTLHFTQPEIAIDLLDKLAGEYGP